MVKIEGDTYSEVVIVIEATANMVSHWEAIKKQYIIPALNQFNNRMPSSNEDFIFTESKNSYGLVLFHAADISPNSTTQCLEPTKNLQTFQKLLNSIQFYGGGGEHHSFVGEGLATALQLFDDFESLKQHQKTAKYCFLISNTPPYKLPTFDSYNYSGKTFLQLAEMLADKEVNVSVICPRFISDLQQIYLEANNDQQQLMNYAQDKRHLVLISGFKLATEREPVPIVETTMDEDSVPPLSVERTSTPMEATSADVAPTPPPITIPSAPLSVKISQVNSVPQAIESANPVLPTSSLQPIKVSITRPASNINSAMVDTTAFSQPKLLMATGKIPEPAMNNSVFNPSQPMSAVQAKSVGFSTSGQQIQPGQSISTVAHPLLVNTQLTQPRSVTQVDATNINIKQESFSAAKEEAIKVSKMAEATAKPMERKLIWSGNLEWQEKRPAPLPSAPNNRVQIKHSSACQILAPLNNSQVEINVNNWPQTVMMQNIPQALITNPKCQSYLRSHRTVHIRFPPANQSQLINMFAKKMCGLIHINIAQPVETKIIIVVFLKNSTATGANPEFIGVMPSDPSGLLNAIKTFVAAARGLQPPNLPQQQQDNPQIQPNAAQVGYGGNQFGQTVPRQNFMNQQQQPISYQPGAQGNPQMNVVSSRINQPINQNPVAMGNAMRTINIQSMPQQSNRNIQMQQNMMHGQQGGIRSNNPNQGGMAMGMNNMNQNMSVQQRVLASAQSGLPISNPNNHNMLNMQQMQPQQSRMQMRGNRPTGNEQLRHLLRDNSQGQSPGMMANPGIRQPNSTLAQQQTFMRSNMGQGNIQNQRHF